MEPWLMQPREIEEKSMSVIRERLEGRSLEPGQEPVILRVIHTTADFDYAGSLYFSPGAVEAAQRALEQGCDILCDTNMAAAGINKGGLSKLGGTVHCFMADKDVAEEAARRNITRAAVSMEKARSLERPFIAAVGNAPTALVRLHQLIGEGKLSPLLVIGVPVGFVNVVEAKELFVDGPVPAIVNRGNKGGSNVAAAICNALIYKAAGR